MSQSGDLTEKKKWVRYGFVLDKFVPLQRMVDSPHP